MRFLPLSDSGFMPSDGETTTQQARTQTSLTESGRRRGGVWQDSPGIQYIPPFFGGHNNRYPFGSRGAVTRQAALGVPSERSVFVSRDTTMYTHTRTRDNGGEQ